jgi:hypothetical protein
MQSGKEVEAVGGSHWWMHSYLATLSNTWSGRSDSRSSTPQGVQLRAWARYQVALAVLIHGLGTGILSQVPSSSTVVLCLASGGATQSLSQVPSGFAGTDSWSRSWDLQVAEQRSFVFEFDHARWLHWNQASLFWKQMYQQIFVLNPASDIGSVSSFIPSLFSFQVLIKVPPICRLSSVESWCYLVSHNFHCCWIVSGFTGLEICYDYVDTKTWMQLVMEYESLNYHVLLSSKWFPMINIELLY